MMRLPIFFLLILFQIEIFGAVLRDYPIHEALNFYNNSLKFSYSFYKTEPLKFETEHFVIYYGEEFPKTSLWSDANNNTVPDFVELTAAILEQVWNKEVDDLDLGVPYGNVPIPVYIANTGIYLNGQLLTLPDNVCGFSSISNGNSYIVLNANPPYSPYTNSIDMLKITIAHEFFHLIQFSYKIDPNPINLWLYEGTAVLAEHLVYPEIKDYIYSYAGEFLENPEKGLIYYEEILHPYSTVLFFDYLVNKYSTQIIKTIWLNFQNSETALEALSLSLIDLNKEIFEFYKNLIGDLNFLSNKDLLETLIKENFFEIPFENTKNKDLILTIYPTGALFLQENNCLDVFNPYASMNIGILGNYYNNTWINFMCLNTKTPLVITPDNFSILELNPIHVNIFLQDSTQNVVELKLKSGWNLVGLKVELENIELLNTSEILSVWLWNGSEWEVYIPDAYPDLKQLVAKYGLKEIEKISSKSGLWIKTVTPFSINLERDFNTLDFKLSEKWSLYAIPTFNTVNFEELYNLNKFQIVWVWDNENNSWKVYVPTDKAALLDLVNKYKIQTIQTLNGSQFNGFWILKTSE